MKNISLFFCLSFFFLLFSSSSATAQNIPDFLVNEQGCIDGAQQTEPYMAGDGNGNYVITWKDKRNGLDYNIFAQIYLSNGTPSGENFKVNDDTGNGHQYTPAIAVAPNLNFIIAWIDRRNGDPNTDWDVYAQRFSSSGTALGDNFIVNDELETDEKSHPSVSIDSSGNFVIVWADRRSSPWDIYGQRFLSNGTALGNNFKINDDIGNYWQLWPTSSCDKNGNLIVSWTDERYNSDRQIYAQRYSPDGITLGENFKVNTDITGTNHLRPDITIDGNSNFIIAWEDNRNGYFDIFAQRYLSDGSVIGDNFMINEDTPNTSQRNPSISSDLTGNFTICWEDNRNDYRDVYARRYSNDGTPLESDFKVNTDATTAMQQNSVIATDEDGNFLICWEDQRHSFNGEIFAQSYLNDGVAVGDNFIVNHDEASENQRWPSIAKDIADNFIITWVDYRAEYSGIYAQRFTSDGATIGNNFKVNDDTLFNITNYPSVAISPDGSYVIAWADYRQENSSIFAQRYTSEGTPWGSNFKVSYLSAGMNYGSVVVFKPNGDFIICWGDADEGGKDNVLFKDRTYDHYSEKLTGEPDIWAQQFLNDGTPIGENFKVNDDGGFESQMNPDIAVDASGNFVVVWEDHRNDIYEIYFQRYLSNGSPLGSNSKVEEIIYCEYALSPSISMEEMGNFNITWRDNRNEYFDIFCKRFSSNGAAIGNSFQVNLESGVGYRDSPSISTNMGGSFTIAWTNVDDGNHDVYAQQYLNDGTPYGSNYRISITDVMEQSAPEVVLGNSRIFYAWQDNSDGHTGFDIWARVTEWDNITGIENKLSNGQTPISCLNQNFPNPFQLNTKISYTLNEPGFVSLNIYDLEGRRLKSLVNEYQNANNYSVIANCSEFEAGMYFYKIEIEGGYYDVKKMIIIR